MQRSADVKALLILLLMGLAAAFCFWRAYRIQVTRSVDGIVAGRYYPAMRIWVAAGAGLLAIALVFAYAAVDPAFNSIGKR